MGDGISDAHRAQRDYEDWDAPYCWICVQKFPENEMREHIESHSVNKIIDFLYGWSISQWKGVKD